MSTFSNVLLQHEPRIVRDTFATFDERKYTFDHRTNNVRKYAPKTRVERRPNHVTRRRS